MFVFCNKVAVFSEYLIYALAFVLSNSNLKFANMKLKDKRFVIFEGTMSCFIFIVGIIYVLCGFGELFGVAEYFFLFLPSHILAGIATWLVCKKDYWANLTIWQIVFSFIISLLILLFFMQGEYILFLAIMIFFVTNIFSMFLIPFYCLLYGIIINKGKKSKKLWKE